MPNTRESLTQTRLAAALRGGAPSSPPREEWQSLLEAAGDHGVLPLLADAAANARWDRELLAEMRPALAAETALAMLRHVELRRVLGALAAAGVQPLVIKGAHLAFTCYRSPDRRPRIDTDLLIRERDKTALRKCLGAIGYEPVPHVTGEVAFSQFSYRHVDARGTSHTLDIHWRIAIPKAFAERLGYDDLRRDAVNVIALGAHALAPSPPHALLIACLHRTAHHGTTDRLLWLYDIHLLATVLSSEEWEVAVARALETGLAPVVAAGLEHAAAQLGTVVPDAVRRRLRDSRAIADPDVLMFLAGEPSRLEIAASDWRRLQGVGSRLQFLREHLFPSSQYMRHRYGVSSSAALPFLYAHRAVTGAVKWVTRPL
jgi:hypothetical protein